MEANLMLAGTSALLGAAGGVWGVVTVWDHKRKQPPLKTEPQVVHVDIDAAELRKDLAEVPAKLEAAFGRALAKLEPPPVLDLPEPDWHKGMLEDMALANERMTAAATRMLQPPPQPQPELEKLLAEVVRINARLGGLPSTFPQQPVLEFPELEKKLDAIAQCLAKLSEPDWHREMLEDMRIANERMTAIAARMIQPQPEPEKLLAGVAGINARLQDLLTSTSAQPVIEFPDLSEPDWHREMFEDMRIANERMTAAATRMLQPPPEPEKLLAEAVRINAQLEDLLTSAQPVLEFPELEKKLDAIAQCLAEAVEHLVELPVRLTNGSNVKITAMVSGGGGTGGGGGNLPPAPRRLPPAPRAAPAGPMPATPLVPAPYVGGSIVVPAGQSSNLFALIQQQLSPNCPGSSAELMLSADDPVLVGSASALGGALSETNYAFQLTPGGPPRNYHSSFPGNSTPLADLQVFSTDGGVMHVEVTT